VMIALDHIPGQVIKTTPPNVIHTTAGHPDCSSQLKDPSDKHCQVQFCAAHQDAPACQIEP